MAGRRRTKTEPAGASANNSLTEDDPEIVTENNKDESEKNGAGKASTSSTTATDEGSSQSVPSPASSSISCPDPDQIVSGSYQTNKSEEGKPQMSSAASPAPFDSEEAAIKELETIDYSIKITAEMAREGKAPRRVRVYADGIYDLFHQGHARQLMQCKNVFPKSDVYLLVGCCSDALTRAKKGKTVMDEGERYEALRHCRYVDEVVREAPWQTDDEFLTKHKIDFVAHDDVPYTIGSGEDIYAWLKERGMFVATQRTEGVSTSDVVARILKDYDTFIRRNLARGYTPNELNVSFIRGKKLQLANKVDELKETVKRKTDEYKSTSKDLIEGFVHLFGQQEFSFDRFWDNSRQRITQALSPSASPEVSEDEEEDEVEQSPSASRKKSSPTKESFSFGTSNTTSLKRRTPPGTPSSSRKGAKKQKK